MVTLAPLFTILVAEAAVSSLEEEVLLTPKPGLVDQNDNGSHDDLTLDIMIKSANSLKSTFQEIANISYGKEPSQHLREAIAEIGRRGEDYMFKTTNNVNTHKGAIWALGLITAAFSMHRGNSSSLEILETAGQIAEFPDAKFAQNKQTNGSKVVSKYNVPGARGEAALGFPTIRESGLPVFNDYQASGYDQKTTLLMTLMSLIANLPDTCILHRCGEEGLSIAKDEASQVLETGDLTQLKEMNKLFVKLNISPGGSADMLAAILFLDKLNQIKLRGE